MKRIVNKLLIYFLLVLFLLGLGFIAYILIYNAFQKHFYKEEATIRVYSFLADYSGNSEKAIIKYDAKIQDGQIKDYETFDCKFVSLKDIGDGDPIYEIKHMVTLIYKNSKQKYSVEQIRYGDWMGMDWIKINKKYKNK